MKVKVEELRIGNLVQNKDGVCTLRHDKHTGQLWLQANKDGGESHEGMNPIPLTEEWLVRFGFEEVVDDDSYDYIHQFGNLEVDADWHDGKLIGVRVEYIEHTIKHVHQLQNLYFALTGTELTIKNK